MNGGANGKRGGVRLLGGTSQGHGQCHHSIQHIQLPIRLYAAILYFFEILSELFVESRRCYPTCIWCPRWGWRGWNFTKIFGVRKLGSLCYRVFCLRDPVFSRFSRVKVAHTRLPSVGFRSWSRFFAVSLQVMWVINPAVGCHYFPPGLELPPQPLRGLLPILLLGEQRHNGCEQFA